jgi:hypothetical protein
LQLEPLLEEDERPVLHFLSMNNRTSLECLKAWHACGLKDMKVPLKWGDFGMSESKTIARVRSIAQKAAGCSKSRVETLKNNARLSHVTQSYGDEFFKFVDMGKCSSERDLLNVDYLATGDVKRAISDLIAKGTPTNKRMQAIAAGTVALSISTPAHASSILQMLEKRAS